MNINQYLNGDYKVSELAASRLGVPRTSQDTNTIICAVEELASLPERNLKQKVVAVYGETPSDAYFYRQQAYERADVCLSRSSQLVERLRLLHPYVLETTLCHESVSPSSQQLVASSSSSWLCEKIQMTILFLTHSFKVGGLEQVVIDMALLARRLGHNVIIGYADAIDDIPRETIEALGIEHVHLPETFSQRKEFLQKRSISLVNAHYATILAEECQEIGIPYLQTIHNMYLWLDGPSISQWQRLDSLTSGYIAVSANAAMVADLRLGLSVDKMLIIPNGINRGNWKPACRPERDEELRAEIGIPSHGIVFCQIASINGVKGHLVALEAFAKALEVRDDIYLVLLGEEADLNFVELIKNKIKQLKISDHVRMLGYRKDVNRFLNLCRSIVAPSFVEGWSLAINEALQLGVPVIATDVGGACEQLRSKEHIVLPAFLENVEKITAQYFFSALTDESLHKKVAPRIADAFLQVAERPCRESFEGNLSGFRSTEETYKNHLEVMQYLVQHKSIKSLRRKNYVQQRGVFINR